MEKIRIDLYQFICCLSDALDLVSPKIHNHHQQVAYLSYRLAEQLGFSSVKCRDIVFASLIHDIGAISNIERLEIMESEPIHVNHHALRGARILHNFKPLRDVANIIKFHHLPWKDGAGCEYKGETVPIESHIIHLADRACAKLQKAKPVLSQLPGLLKEIMDGKNTLYEPNLVEAFNKLGKKEYIWLDLTYTTPISRIPEIGMMDMIALDLDEVIDIAFVFSNIIDFRSSFTARHSAGVAKTAVLLAKLLSFSPYEQKLMLISGYLHDLGKLAVDSNILEKGGKLTEKEFEQVRAHTYYTYHLLEEIPQFEIIKRWAAYHHEKLNGNGYPFHLKGDVISLGSRIMAVADIFTAITEDRPYRKGMTDEKAVEILINMSKRNEIDGNVVTVLVKNFDSINENRQEAQKQAENRYKEFLLF